MISGLVSLACIFGSAVLTEIVRERRHRAAESEVRRCIRGHKK